MNWITDRIAIGNYLEARNVVVLSQSGFRSILSLDGSLSEIDPEDLNLEEIVTFELKDGPGNDPSVFRKAVQNLIGLVQDFPPVLVHCHAGRSRSVIVVAGYLMQSLNIGAEKAIAIIGSKREINVSDGLKDLLYR